MEILLMYGEILASILVIALCAVLVSIPAICRSNRTDGPMSSRHGTAKSVFAAAPGQARSATPNTAEPLRGQPLTPAHG